MERRRYNRLGQLTAVELPDGSGQQYGYDAAGNVVRADNGRQQTMFAYTPMGQLAQRQQGGQAVAFHYDLEGNLTGLTNEQGEVHHFTLDATGQVVKEIRFDGLTRRYERDAAGRVVQVLRPAKRQTAYTYDAAGRIAQVQHNEDEAPVRYEYDPTGALRAAHTATSSVTFERDALGRVLTEQQNNHQVSSRYDARGQRQQLSSSLGAAVAFEHDALGQMHRTTAGTNWQATMERDAQGLELHRQLSGGLRLGWRYDAAGRPTSQRITAGGGGGNVRQRRYQWQGADELIEVDDSLSGRTQFGYDAHGALAQATYADGSTELRAPDAVGNLFRTQARTDHRYGKGGQLREASGTRYHDDDEGNLLRKTLPNGQQWHYGWDGAGQLTSVTWPDGYAITFAYDALGRRISKRFRGKVTRWVWGGDKPLHEWHELEVGPGAGSATNVITWLFEHDSFAPTAKLTAAGAQSVVCDHLGTPLELYDERGRKTWQAQLDSYGQVREGKGKPQDCPFRYQGQYEDMETGLYYNRFRYYDPEMGQYVSQDPIGLGGGINLYIAVSRTVHPSGCRDASLRLLVERGRTNGSDDKTQRGISTA